MVSLSVTQLSLKNSFLTGIESGSHRAACILAAWDSGIESFHIRSVPDDEGSARIDDGRNASHRLTGFDRNGIKCNLPVTLVVIYQKRSSESPSQSRIK